MSAHHFAVVGEKDNQGVVAKPLLVEIGEQTTQFGVDMGIEPVIVGDESAPVSL